MNDSDIEDYLETHNVKAEIKNKIDTILLKSKSVFHSNQLQISMILEPKTIKRSSQKPLTKTIINHQAYKIWHNFIEALPR